MADIMARYTAALRDVQRDPPHHTTRDNTASQDRRVLRPADQQRAATPPVLSRPAAPG
jgi:hypothetical protein